LSNKQGIGHKVTDFIIKNLRLLVETPKPYHWDYTKQFRG